VCSGQVSRSSTAGCQQNQGQPKCNGGQPGGCARSRNPRSQRFAFDLRACLVVAAIKAISWLRGKISIAIRLGVSTRMRPPPNQAPFGSPPARDKPSTRKLSAVAIAIQARMDREAASGAGVSEREWGDS
jgi:hypothetical protein